MSKIKLFINEARQVNVLSRDMKNELKNGEDLVVEWGHGSQRSLKANNLYWLWMTELSNRYNIRAKRDGRPEDMTKEYMHDVMRHKFLGYRSGKLPNGMRISAQLISTTSLSKLEFCEYLYKIEAWALNKGVRLARSGEYQKYYLARMNSG